MNHMYWCFSISSLNDALADYRKELDQQDLREMDKNIMIQTVKDFLCSQAAHDQKLVINSKNVNDAHKQLAESEFTKEETITNETGE